MVIEHLLTDTPLNDIELSWMTVKIHAAFNMHVLYNLT